MTKRGPLRLLSIEVENGNFYKLTAFGKEFYATDLDSCLNELEKTLKKIRKRGGIYE